MRVALYQPDIPQNTGTILRLCACLRVPISIIEPAGFDMSSRAFKRAGLDYAQAAELHRFSGFAAFRLASEQEGCRLVLLTTQAAGIYSDFAFSPADVLIAGRESAGVPDKIHEAVDARIRVPMASGFRSLNVAVALAMVLGEGLRQTGGFSGFA